MLGYTEETSGLSLLDRIRIDSIRDNVERWDSLWSSVRDIYSSLSNDEIRASNTKLTVLANSTMNELSALRASLNKKVLSEEVPILASSESDNR